MHKCPPTGGVRLQEVSVSGGSTVPFYSATFKQAPNIFQPVIMVNFKKRQKTKQANLHKINWEKALLIGFQCNYLFCCRKKYIAMDGHFSKLPNSLIEICVVVGMDQDTGLVPAYSSEVI